MKAVFIGGTPRSGTTFLGSLLGGHPACVATPETSFKVDALIARTSRERETIDSGAIEGLLANPRFRTWELDLMSEERMALENASTVLEAMFVLVRAYARVASRTEANIWVDHTPSNIRFVDRLREHFPEAKFIHLVRDGRAVSASVLPLNWGANTIVAAARDWMEYLAAGLAAESKLPADQILRVRYEDLVGDPDAELRRLCEYLQLDYREIMVEGAGFRPEEYSRSIHPNVGRPPRLDRVSAWKQQLEARDIEIFEARTGDMLVCLGYDLEFGWRARGPTFLEMFRMYLGEGGIRARNKAAFRRHLGRYAARDVTR